MESSPGHNLKCKKPGLSGPCVHRLASTQLEGATKPFNVGCSGGGEETREETSFLNFLSVPYSAFLFFLNHVYYYFYIANKQRYF